MPYRLGKSPRLRPVHIFFPLHGHFNGRKAGGIEERQRNTQQPVMGMRESDRDQDAEIPAHGKCKVPYRKEIQVFFIGMGTIPFPIRVHEPYEGSECERLWHSP